MARRSGFYVGIDFGTAQSGFSTCTLGGSPRFIEVYPQQPVPYCKTLSVILYSKELSADWEPTSWGWTAFNQYQELDAEERKEFLLVERCKWQSLK